MKIINQKKDIKIESEFNLEKTNYNDVIKETNKSNATIMKLLIVGGIILIIVGLAYEIPSRDINFDVLNEYVGGDAYNAMIEASIRGGEIAGAMITKTLYICSGLIITALGCFKKN